MKTPTILAAACMVAASFSYSAVHSQVKWNLPTAYAEGNFHTQNVRQFAEEVQALSKGKVEIAVHSGASLYKLPEIKRAVQTGQVQMGELLVSALANDDSMYEVSSIPGLAKDYEGTKNLYAQTKPFIEKRLARDGLKLLYVAPWPTVGIFLREPGDLEGRKIRTYDRATSRFIELLGAIPTTVQAAELPQALATGVVEGMVTSTLTVHDTKAWDYVKAYYDVRASFPMNMVIMNARAFDGLDEPTRQAILKAAAQAEARGWQRAEAIQREMDVAVTQHGVVVITPSPALETQLEQISTQMAAEWAQRAGADGQELLSSLGR